MACPPKRATVCPGLAASAVCAQLAEAYREKLTSNTMFKCQICTPRVYISWLVSGTKGKAWAKIPSTGFSFYCTENVMVLLITGRALAPIKLEVVCAATEYVPVGAFGLSL